MNTSSATLAATLLVMAAAGCATISSPIPMSGSAGDIAALVGEWEGEYHSDADEGRAGSIVFRLATDADTAYGDVLMVAHLPGQPTPVLPRDEIPGKQTLPRSQVLTIRFVSASGGMVSGVMDPYLDPVCGCTLETRFVGRVEGDRVAGTYTSRHLPGGTTINGRWSVVRRKL